MANANTDPLEFRNGVILWSAQAVQGTAVTPATSAGIATGRLTRSGGNQRFRGPGSRNIMARKGGSTSSGVSLSWPAAQTGIKSLLTRAVRVDNVLPWTTLAVGYQDDQTGVNTLRKAWQVQDAKIASLNLALDASSEHSPLTASLEFVGGLVTELTTLAPVTNSSTPWMTHEAVFTREAVAYACRSFDVTIAHEVLRRHQIPGAAVASFPRGWSFLNEGSETISGSISRYLADTVNVHANTITEYDLVLTITNRDDAQVLTLNLTDVDFDEAEISEDDGGIFYSWAFEAKTWSMT